MTVCFSCQGIDAKHATASIPIIRCDERHPPVQALTQLAQQLRHSKIRRFVLFNDEPLITMLPLCTFLACIFVFVVINASEWLVQAIGPQAAPAGAVVSVASALHRHHRSQNVDVITSTILAIQQNYVVPYRGYVNALSAVLLLCVLPSLARCAYLLLVGVREESLLVVQDHGLQIERAFYSGAKQRSFIGLEQVESVLVNEGFQGSRVIYYLAVLVRGKEKMALPFEHLFPRLKLLLFILHSTRAVLYGEREPDALSELDVLFEPPSPAPPPPFEPDDELSADNSPSLSGWVIGDAS